MWEMPRNLVNPPFQNVKEMEKWARIYIRIWTNTKI